MNKKLFLLGMFGVVLVYGIGCDYIFYNDGKMLMLFTEAYGANSVLLQKIPDENSVE